MGFMRRSGKNEEKRSEEQEGGLREATQYFIIDKHSTWRKEIKIFDITSLIELPYLSEAWDDHIRTIQSRIPGKSKDGTEILPSLEISRARFFTSMMTISQPPDTSPIGTWKGSIFSTQKSVFEFPADSPHSSHPIVMKPMGLWTASEEFVKESVRHIGKFDKRLSSRYFTLFKQIGSQEIPVAQYRSTKLSVWIGGGVLAIDDKEIDPVVAVLWCANMLRKVEQRGAESAV
ncbi:hypothetical protein P152DRAFT_201488 [Eremomyces bilateralis CBS 781.70]|uniref:Uncharacterized protein n=1 Tax=Eremomyces bilateralis CBS 781.70 TaxID=1392243 RepID=A0A6G1GDC6_9PEZI|nr:uncharacterized protein P152DRAFT_201488 [Eremomyces bilateralis CBS 781.70]KAF1815910.1 hypothetical protein P152DRAFT_201488 [Eremomyces bilateralis CBS 781.70]